MPNCYREIRASLGGTSCQKELKHPLLEHMEAYVKPDYDGTLTVVRRAVYLVRYGNPTVQKSFASPKRLSRFRNGMRRVLAVAERVRQRDSVAEQT